jgi:co-chaperonin GroES (HSP10)
MQSKYLAQFQRLVEKGSDTFTLNGDRILVEVLPKEELKIGSIIMAPNKDHRNQTEESRACLVLVLLIGEGYVDDDGKDIPLMYKPGEILLVPEPSIRFFSQFPGLPNYTSNAIGLMREGDAHMSWDNFEQYELYKKALNDV